MKKLSILSMLLLFISMGNIQAQTVIPAYQYTNGQRTDTITGYRYSICLPEKGLEKINIRIEGKQLVEALESGYVEVTLSGIEVFLYWQNGAVQVGAKATGISLVNHKG